MLDEEGAAARLEVDDDSDDDQTSVASMRMPEVGVAPGHLLTPQACESLGLAFASASLILSIGLAAPEQLSGPFTPTPRHPSVGAKSSTADRTPRTHTSSLPADVRSARSPGCCPSDAR